MGRMFYDYQGNLIKCRVIIIGISLVVSMALGYFLGYQSCGIF